MTMMMIYGKCRTYVSSTMGPLFKSITSSSLSLPVVTVDSDTVAVVVVVVVGGDGGVGVACVPFSFSASFSFSFLFSLSSQFPIGLACCSALSMCSFDGIMLALFISLLSVAPTVSEK